MKVAENSPQNARNCNFLGGACPQTPLAKARSFAARDMPLRGMYIQNPRNFKLGPPPEKSCIRPWITNKITFVMVMKLTPNLEETTVHGIDMKCFLIGSSVMCF